MKNSLTFHTLVYSASSLLMAVAGVITFPIFTRTFSVEEYGILNLISITITILVGVSKAGLQQSIVRFGSEARSGRKGFKAADIYFTALASMLAIAIVVQLVWSIVSQFLPLSVVGDERAYTIFILAGLMVVGGVLGSGTHNIMVSEKKSFVLSLTSILNRYSFIAIIIPALLLAQDKLFVYYLLSGLHEVAFLILSLYLCHRYFAIFEGRFSLSLNRKLLAYGLPLVGYEVLGQAMSYGDRLQVNYFLGAEALGYYAAASNLCMYIRMIFVASMATAIAPMYMDRWENEGKKATEDFLSLVLRGYLLLAIPAALGVTAVSHDLIGLLAGDKYAEGAQVIPFIIIGMLIDGTVMITAAGLQIEKRTKLMMGIMACVATLNVGLNFLLIPPFGIVGAAVATLTSYLCYTATNLYFGRKILAVRLDVAPVLYYLAAGLVMYWAVTSIDLPILGLRLLLKIGVGGLLYGALVLAIDRELRQIIMGYARPAWNMLRQRWA